ncbi:outer membrane lipoprotein carrier protein LolA [Hydrocarboniphaga sp.]|uniref:outer membrane lipoprotein carrier protein LolA n=1 Tax=Hydrocarboniphaga sp. TaxID=2033016 RepID=UPI0026017147|nr:outer membrane lipoprotein carrier protein LolA [Hydrocarboniphaga sp.]
MKSSLPMLAIGLAAWINCIGGTATAADAVFAHRADPATVQKLLSAPARELSRSPVLRGHFSQRKFLRELPTPLTSSGDFLFARDLGISWHTRVPFDSEFVLSRTGMMQKDSGSVAMSLSSDQQPALQIALRLFVGLFSLDLDALAADFDLYGIKTGEHWQLGLKPKSAAMSAVFNEALVDGATTVESVEMHDASGDRTLITILDMQTAPAPTPEDRRHFAR